ncbi:MAG: type IV secretion system protein [Wolbachia sp.]
MHKFLLIVTLFILSGCDRHCIKPEDLSGLREKLDVVSTKQKWVDSGVYISGNVKVTEISIVPSKVNFCPKWYEDFAIQSGKDPVVVTLPFALKADDSISFSVIGSKMCKNDNSTVTYKKIDESCDKGETEYFAHVLNREECQAIWQNGEYKYTICPNKLMIGSAKWLPGQEYWSSDFSKKNQEKRRKEIENINSIKHGENINCNKLLSDQKSKMINTYILNLACKNICHYSSQNCVEIESNTIDDGNLIKSLDKALVSAENKVSEITKVTKKITEKGEIKTHIPSLIVSTQKKSFNAWTNYDHKVEKDHPQGEKLTFAFACKDQCKGGYNIRVTKIPNLINLKNSLYIRVSDTFPEHDPDETHGDILIDVNEIYDIKYMESLKDKLKNKSGTIYYGIRNHGCDYKENEGQFSIKLTIKEPPTRTFSVIYNFFDKKVKTTFFGSRYKDSNAVHSESSPVKSLYQNLVASNRMKTIRSTIVSLLILYIVLYTLYYFFGLTHVSIYEFLIICIKIGIIIQLLQDNSWDFFYNNAFSIFINIPKQLIEITNFRGTTSNVFEFLNLTLNRFLSVNSIILIISLIFSGPLGIVSFCLVIWGLTIVILSIFNALFSFITSIAIVMLLLSLTPIFIISLLFTYTRQMFHNWVKNLARFTIHPVVLLIFISLVSQVMDYIVYSVFNFEVCTTCILKVDLKIFKICIFSGYTSKYTPNITTIMAFVILSHAMKALIESSSKISDSLFGVYVQEESGKQYQHSLMGLIGLDEQSVHRRQAERGEGIQPSSKGSQMPIIQRTVSSLQQKP